MTTKLVFSRFDNYNPREVVVGERHATPPQSGHSRQTEVSQVSRNGLLNDDYDDDDAEKEDYRETQVCVVFNFISRRIARKIGKIAKLKD